MNFAKRLLPALLAIPFLVGCYNSGGAPFEDAGGADTSAPDAASDAGTDSAAPDATLPTTIVITSADEPNFTRLCEPTRSVFTYPLGDVDGCDTDGDYLEVTIPSSGGFAEERRYFTVGEDDIQARLCRADECTSATEGRFVLSFLAVGETASLSGALSFGDQRVEIESGSVPNWCWDFTPCEGVGAQPPARGYSRAACGPDDGPAWEIILPVYPEGAIRFCDVPEELYVRVTLYADALEVGGRYDLTDPAVGYAAICDPEGDCSEFLAGTLDVDALPDETGLLDGQIRDGFASPGISVNYEFITSVCREDAVLCG